MNLSSSSHHSFFEHIKQVEQSSLRAIERLKEEKFVYESNSESETASDVEDDNASADALAELVAAGVVTRSVVTRTEDPTRGSVVQTSRWIFDFMFNQCMVMLLCLVVGAILVPVLSW